MGCHHIDYNFSNSSGDFVDSLIEMTFFRVSIASGFEVASGASPDARCVMTKALTQLYKFPPTFYFTPIFLSSSIPFLARASSGFSFNAVSHSFLALG